MGLKLYKTPLWISNNEIWIIFTYKSHLPWPTNCLKAGYMCSFSFKHLERILPEYDLKEFRWKREEDVFPIWETLPEAAKFCAELVKLEGVQVQNVWLAIYKNRVCVVEDVKRKTTICFNKTGYLSILQEWTLNVWSQYLHYLKTQ